MTPKPDPNGNDYGLPYYPQPKCVVCGQFAGKRGGLWTFSCTTYNEPYGWEHR